jgi:hypothetical protein
MHASLRVSGMNYRHSDHIMPRNIYLKLYKILVKSVVNTVAKRVWGDRDRSRTHAAEIRSSRSLAGYT